MKTYFASDQHLCDGTGSFYPYHQDFHNFLDLVGDDDLIIGGDLMDLWCWSLEDILNGPNKDIIQRLKDKKNVRLILGNHDLYPKEMKEVFQGVGDISMGITMGKWTLLHGHQSDPYLDTPEERWFAAAGARFFQWANNSWLNKIRDAIATGDRTNDPMIKNLEGKGNYILGHSHVPIDLGWYLNCGCWIDNDHAYILIKDDGTATLEKFPCGGK